MSERFYLDRPLLPGPVELDGAEAHHLAHVSRLRPGDALRLFNGDGQEYPARVVAAHRRAVSLDVLGVDRPERELAFRLEVAAPVPKGDRAQFLVEKLTELGVTTFIPLACQRSIVHPRESRHDKFARHVIEASKQCGRNVLMAVGALTDWASYCVAADPATVSVVAHPGSVGGLRRVIREARNNHPDLALRLAVGPEGGFTDAEIALARAAGWHLADLGPRLLRIETAALALVVLATEAMRGS